MAKADIGLIGLAVMGQNLVLNMNDHGFTVAVYNRTVAKVDEFLASGRRHPSYRRALAGGAGRSVKKPRRVMLMVKAGQPVDDDRPAAPAPGTGRHPDRRRQFPFSRHHPPDRIRRIEGIALSAPASPAARKAPASARRSCPAVRREAWPHVKPIFQAICGQGGNRCSPAAIGSAKTARVIS